MTKNPWSRSLLDTPSPPPSDEDGGGDGNGDEYTNRDIDLLAELDLSRRDDRAVVLETPFSLARQRAQRAAHRAPGDAFCGSIVTAEDAFRAQVEGLPAPRRAPSPPSKREWKRPVGWTDARGDALVTADSGRRATIPAKGTTTMVKRPTAPKRPATEIVRPPPKKRKAPAKKKAAAADDKIQFGMLPELDPSFPIVAGLNNQRALPPKPKAAPKKRATKAKAKPASASPPPAPVQKTLKEIDFLVSGGPNAQAARKKVQENLEAFAYKPTTLSSTLPADFKQWTYTSAPSGSKRKAAVDDDEVELRAPQAPVSAERRATQAVSSSSLPSRQPSQANGLPSPPHSSSPIIVAPRPVTSTTVSQLEAMVEDGFDLSNAPEPPKNSRHSDMPASPPLSYPRIDAHHSSPAHRPSPFRVSSLSPLHRAQPFLPPPLPMELEAELARESSRSPPSFAQRRLQEWNQGVQSSSASAQHVSQQLHMNSQPSQPSYPSQSSQARRAPNSRWAAALSGSTDAEWSTLPARRTRLTMRPATAPKSTSFRVPLDRLMPARSREHEHHSPVFELSPSPEPQMQPQPTTRVTVWAPTPLTQSNASASAGASAGPSQGRGYAPPGVQALHQIQAGLPMSIPEPAAQAEGDDWEAAWSRSGNIAEQLG